jgi:WD40 repeat protein
VDQPHLAPPTLFDLLARQWQRPSGIATIAFNADQSAIAFAGEDGSLALVAMADAEAPATRVRTSIETGRSSIRPREKPVRPAVVVGPVDDRAPLLAPYRRSSFAVSDRDGKILSITPRGQIAPFATRLHGRATALATHVATGRIAWAGGGQIALAAQEEIGSPTPFRHARIVTALAFSPDGAQLAASDTAGVSLWRCDRDSPPAELAFAGAPMGVAWSPDGHWLACPLEEEGFQLLRLADDAGGAVLGYPTPTRSLAWSGPGQALVTAGAYRVAAWSMAAPPLTDAAAGALQTGRPGLVVVEQVAAHPSRDLIAAGYANGQVSIMRLGQRDEMLVRQDGKGAVTALVWSPDGEHLALGTADGLAAVVSFPPHLFK